MNTEKKAHVDFAKNRTQLPQAAGIAYALKMEGRKACAVTYFGDGASSEVAVH